MTRRVRWLGFVALALFLGACSIDATVTVKVRDDGSGYVDVAVTADQVAVQAAEAGGGTLEERVRLADLPEAGWAVEPWSRNIDGSATLSMRKRFTDVDQIAGILRELNGSEGPLQDASFSRTRSFFSTKYRATVRLDLSQISTGIAEDAELVQQLAAQGIDVAGVDRRLLEELQRAVGVRVVVELPGRDPVTVEPAAGDAATLDASSTVDDTTRITLVAIAAGLVVLALVVAVWPRRRGRPSAWRPSEQAIDDGTPPTRRGTPRAT